MLGWFIRLSDTNRIAVIGVIVVPIIISFIVTFGGSQKNSATIVIDSKEIIQFLSMRFTQEQYTQELKEQEQGIHNFVVNQPLSVGQRVVLPKQFLEIKPSVSDYTLHNAVIIEYTQEQYTQGLKEKEQAIRTLLIDQTLNERQRIDLTMQLLEVEERLRDSTKSYQNHIASLKQRIEELEPMGKTISKTLLDEAIAALKTGDTEKAAEVLAEVELSAQYHIEVAAEAVYQRAKTAEDDLQYRKAFDHAMRASQLMPEESRYLNLAGNIAETLGEYGKAIGYYELALASDLVTFGEDHPNVAANRNNLGGVWYLKGEYDKSIGYYELALKSGIAIFGEDHLIVATYYNNLGSAWNALGEYGKATGYLEQALASDLATFWEDHPSVAIRRNNLGSAWESKGEYDKAIEYYEQALATMKKVFGDHHPSTQTVQRNLERAQNEQ